MEVTGQLNAPMVKPCPGLNDLAHLKDAQCHPVRCTRQPDFTGTDCCQYWKNAPNVWNTDLVRVDRVNPEKFSYDNYRYQLYVKPASSIAGGDRAGSGYVPDKFYVAPNTDIRALRQTTYIPVLPHNPGGVSQYTFPMTPQTMNDPDMTTACCVPVIPCNPGFENLTPGVRTDPSRMCQTYNSCKQPMQIGPRRVNIDAEVSHSAGQGTCCSTTPGPMPGPPVQYMMPPSNQPGGSCIGLPDTFPEPRQQYQRPHIPGLHPPHFVDSVIGGQGCPGMDAYDVGIDMMGDGIDAHSGPGMALTSLKNLRYQDRVQRAYAAKAERQDERIRRLKEMYGAFGSYLVATPYTRRHLEGVRDTITQQGNGFAWSYPKNDNRLCYVIQRNPRC